VLVISVAPEVTTSFARVPLLVAQPVAIGKPKDGYESEDCHCRDHIRAVIVGHARYCTARANKCLCREAPSKCLRFGETVVTTLQMYVIVGGGATTHSRPASVIRRLTNLFLSA
jgi:hypothetical protein